MGDVKHVVSGMPHCQKCHHNNVLSGRQDCNPGVHFRTDWCNITAHDACCACGGGSLKVLNKPHRGLQIFKGDDLNVWSIQGNPSFHVDFKNRQGDAVLQLKSICVDTRCNSVELHLSNAGARGAWQGMHRISLDTIAASPAKLPRLRETPREWASDQGVILSLELLVTANSSGFKVEWAPWDAGNSYFYRTRNSVEAGLLDVKSSVNVESLNKASITVVSGLCHSSCDLCTHFAGKFSSAEEKAKLCISCPSGRSLDVVHGTIAAGRCVLDSQQRFDSIEQYGSTGTFSYLKVFSSSDWYPACWDELMATAAGVVVDDLNCSNQGTHLCDDFYDSTNSFLTYCSTYDETASYSESSRCRSPDGDAAMQCFKCEPHLAQCRCGKWKAKPGETWELSQKPYWRGSPSSQMHGALVLTACPAGQKLIGGLDKIQQQQCIACKHDDEAWPRWSIALDSSHSSSGFGIEWRFSAGRICPNEYWSAHDDSYTLLRLERNTMRNEMTLTKFRVGGHEASKTQKLNLTTHGTFEVRLAETVSESGEVKIGLLFSGHNPGGSNEDFFDLGCILTAPPTWEQWRHILNLFEKKLVIQGSGLTSAEPVADEFRIGKGNYLTEINLVSKRAEDIAGGGQCLPCPAGGICIKGMFIFSTGKNQLVAREWGSSGGWAQGKKDGRVQLVTCPENYTKFPFATTGIVDEWMQLSMQACVKT